MRAYIEICGRFNNIEPVGQLVVGMLVKLKVGGSNPIDPTRIGKVLFAYKTKIKMGMFLF